MDKRLSTAVGLGDLSHLHRKTAASAPMEIESHMPGNGVIFSEGIEADFITFSYGITAAVTVAEKQDPLVV